MKPDRRGTTQGPMHAAASRILAQAAVGLAAIAALLLTAMPAAARADDDLPGRVGRVADVAGELYLAPQDRPAEWAPIGRNYTVISGDNLWVAAGGRAEVDYGGGQFRLAGDTSVHLSRLDDSRLVLFVAQGWLIVRIRSLEPGEQARVDAPNAQIHLTRVGLYRIEVAPDGGTTFVTVREGEARVALVDGVQQALPGQTVTVSGADPVAADVRNGYGEDGFDAWSADRDRYYERGASAAYVSPEMVGYADLDPYGSWQQLPDYGAVWFPHEVATDWAPYSDGYWTNVGGWGIDLGRLRALGLCPVPLRPLGLGRRALGLVPGPARRAAALGAGAGRVAGRTRLGTLARPRLAGVRLDPARLARPVPAALARLLRPLLVALQPPVWRRRAGASAPAAVDLREQPGPRRAHRRRRRDARRCPPGREWPAAGAGQRRGDRAGPRHAAAAGAAPGPCCRRQAGRRGAAGGIDPRAAGAVAPGQGGRTRRRHGRVRADRTDAGRHGRCGAWLGSGHPRDAVPGASAAGGGADGSIGAGACRRAAGRHPCRRRPHRRVAARPPGGQARAGRGHGRATDHGAPARLRRRDCRRGAVRDASGSAVARGAGRAAVDATRRADRGRGSGAVRCGRVGGVPPAVPPQAVPRGAATVAPQAVAPAAPQGGAAAPVPAGHGTGRPATGAADAPQGGPQRGAPPPAPATGGGLSR